MAEWAWLGCRRLSEPSGPRASSSEWVAHQTSLQWLASGFLFHEKMYLIFYSPSMWLATSQEEHFKWFHYIFFSFSPHLSQNFCTIPSHWCLHRISYSAKGNFGPIMTGIFHAWQIGCRWHHLKLLYIHTKRRFVWSGIFKGIAPNVNGYCAFLSFLRWAQKQAHSWMPIFKYFFFTFLLQNLLDLWLKD